MPKLYALLFAAIFTGTLACNKQARLENTKKYPAVESTDDDFWQLAAGTWYTECKSEDGNSSFQTVSKIRKTMDFFSTTRKYPSTDCSKDSTDEIIDQNEIEQLSKNSGDSWLVETLFKGKKSQYTFTLSSEQLQVKGARSTMRYFRRPPTSNPSNPEGYVTPSRRVDIGDVLVSLQGLDYQHCLIGSNKFFVVFTSEQESASKKEYDKRMAIQIDQSEIPDSETDIYLGNDDASLILKTQEGTWSLGLGGSCKLNVGTSRYTEEDLRPGIPQFEMDAELICNNLPSFKMDPLSFTLPIQCVGLKFP